MKCHTPDRTLDCVLCLTVAGAPCPLADVDTSHQGREDPPAAPEVSTTPDETPGPVDAPDNVVQLSSRRPWAQPKPQVDHMADINRELIEPLQVVIDGIKGGEMEPIVALGLLQRVSHIILTRYDTGELPADWED